MTGEVANVSVLYARNTLYFERVVNLLLNVISAKVQIQAGLYIGEDGFEDFYNNYNDDYNNNYHNGYHKGFHKAIPSRIPSLFSLCGQGHILILLLELTGYLGGISIWCDFRQRLKLLNLAESSGLRPRIRF